MTNKLTTTKVLWLLSAILCSLMCTKAKGTDMLDCSELSDNTYVVNITIMVPYEDIYKFSKGKVTYAVEKAYNDSLYGDALEFINITNYKCLIKKTSFTLNYLDTNCSSYTTSRTLADIRDTEIRQECEIGGNVSTAIEVARVTIGNSCDYPTSQVESVTSHWEWTTILAGVRSVGYNDKSAGKHGNIVRTGVTSNNAGVFLASLFKRYGWNKTSIVYTEKNGHGARLDVDASTDCSTMTAGITNVFRQNDWSREDYYTYYDHGSDALLENHLDDTLTAIRKTSRISLWCVGKKTMRRVMVRAAQMGMTNGEFAFIYMDFYNSNRNYAWSDVDDMPDKDASYPYGSSPLDNVTSEELSRALQALNIISLAIPTTDKFTELSESVQMNVTEGMDSQFINNYIVTYYDTVIMYLAGLFTALDVQSQSSSSNDYILQNGSSFVSEYLWGREYMSLDRKLKIDSNGDMIADYTMFDYNIDTGEFEEALFWSSYNDSFVPKIVIDWPGDVAPANFPVCGSYVCPNDISTDSGGVFYIIGACAGVIVVFCVVTIILFRKMRTEKKLRKEAWRINYEDIEWDIDRKISVGSRSMRSSMHSICSSNLSLSIMGVTTKQKFAKVGVYNNFLVAVKELRVRRISLDRTTLKEMQELLVMEHQHICKFFGANEKTPSAFIVTEYCARGSLSDLVENIGEFEMDDVFKNSLISDIISGMLYIHRSKFQFHGNLKSTNCLIDSRFVVKLTDFRMDQFRDAVVHKSINQFKLYERKLWFAPEILRLTTPLSKVSAADRQRGDVYSFGIIVQEVIFRRGVFHTEEDLQPKEIYDRVVEHRSSLDLFRPTLDDDDDVIVLSELRAMVNKCWDENPINRPNFSDIHHDMKKIFKEKSLVDSLIQRLEQHTRNLEDKVAERTEQYQSEKEKADNLLYQMLPRSVADSLKKGNEVVPLDFENVTIFFSDIVGFTAISHESTPIDVVNMLNDLYTMFDRILELFDVYKVETIGDAYMVVSGLPNRNGNMHAREIARMSLLLLKNANFFVIRHKPETKLRLRIGLHTGPVVAGVVGLKMPRYCLFGDTVNSAARMESNGKPLAIHVSPATKAVLDDFGSFILEEREDEVYLKGLGYWKTWWLQGEDVRSEEESIHYSEPYEERVDEESLGQASEGNVITMFDSDLERFRNQAGRNSAGSNRSIYVGAYDRVSHKSSVDSVLQSRNSIFHNRTSTAAQGNKTRSRKNARFEDIRRVTLDNRSPLTSANRKDTGIGTSIGPNELYLNEAYVTSEVEKKVKFFDDDSEEDDDEESNEGLRMGRDSGVYLASADREQLNCIYINEDSDGGPRTTTL